jgi:hypothetical protein
VFGSAVALSDSQGTAAAARAGRISGRRNSFIGTPPYSVSDFDHCSTRL